MLFLPVSVSAQDFLIDDVDGTTVDTCSGTFFDSGGNSSNYAGNENFSTTFTSNIIGANLLFSFSENNWNVQDSPTCAFDGL